MFLPRSTIRNLYITYIRPYHDYCDIIFDGHITTHDSIRLERFQNRVARLITCTPLRTSSDRLRSDIGCETLKIRREIHRLISFHRLIQSQNTPNYIKSILPTTRTRVTNFHLRNAKTLSLPPNNTTSFQRSFIPNTTRKWNRLPSPIREETGKSTFKRELTKLLGCPSPPPYYSYGSKIGNSLHTQIRTGTLPLNAYLYQIQKSESPVCPCGYRTENVKHFILNCPLHQNIRHVLFSNVSETLGTDCSLLPTTRLTDLLLHGTSLDPEGGRRVAECFQSYVKGALAARRAAAADGDVVALV